jgi:hypothetical protein
VNKIVRNNFESHKTKPLFERSSPIFRFLDANYLFWSNESMVHFLQIILKYQNVKLTPWTEVVDEMNKTLGLELTVKKCRDKYQKLRHSYIQTIKHGRPFRMSSTCWSLLIELFKDRNF